LKIVIVSDHAYLPERAGGRESSIHELASLYQDLGHDVTVVALARVHGKGPGRWNGRLGRALSGRLWRPSYRVRRVHDLEAEIERLAAGGLVDALVLNVDRVGQLAGRPRIGAIPVRALYLRDLDNIDPLALSAVPSDTLLVANSSVTAQRYASVGRDVLEVPPLVSVGRYETHACGDCVTFINPEPRKGVEIALGVAGALPHIPFLFVEAWPLSRSRRAALVERLAGLPNVSFMDWVLDVRRVYAQTRVLLVPSQWEEAFCRVVVEAQASGIPSVASRRGALPATVGEAGLFVGADESVEVWSSAVHRLWDDHALRAELSALARTTAARHYENARTRSIALLKLLEERATGAGHALISNPTLPASPRRA